MRSLLFLHLVAVSLWLGGQLFIILVALPALRSQDPEARQATLRAVGKQFGVVAVPTLLVVLITGAAMMDQYGLSASDSDALRHKLELVGVVIAGTVVHSIAGAKRRRRLSRVASIITLAATLGVIWFATGI